MLARLLAALRASWNAPAFRGTALSLLLLWATFDALDAIDGALERLLTSQTRPVAVEVLNPKAAAQVRAEAKQSLPVEQPVLCIAFEGSGRETEWQIATLGEEIRPLAKVASGGELSRIMLALKGMLAEADDTPTLIFDEVDSGIGGGMAEVVGRKLAGVSAGRQVLCVTHLPQIAAMADAHYRVEKRTRGGRTETSLSRLEGDDRVAEVARMLGGAGDSDLPRRHAAAILERAGRLRKAGRRGGRG